jgi:hypothetical protein
MSDILSDPCWFPLRYDVRADAAIFARIAPEMHRALTFISDFRPTVTQSIARAEIGEMSPAAPMHLIIHSGLGGSTLLARALAQPGVVTTLKEPPIFTGLAAFRLQASREETRRLLEQLAGLLSRPFTPGESLVCKMSSVGNGFGADLAELSAGTRILCLQTPLDHFLASLTSKGAEGRAGGRKLYVGLQNSRMSCVSLNQQELKDCDDLQLAALAWLSIQKMMVDAANKFGARRVASIASEKLLGNPRISLSAVADHFHLRLDVGARIESGVFSRHAKTGEPFDTQKRAAALGRTLRDCAAEILPVVDWARKVSEAIGIAWSLPFPLI